MTAATLAAIRRFGKRMEVTVPQEPALNGLYTLRVLIQSPPELAAKYAYLGLAQGLANERQVVQVLILPPSGAGGLPEILYRPVYPTTDRQIAELFARGRIGDLLAADGLWRAGVLVERGRGGTAGCAFGSSRPARRMTAARPLPPAASAPRP